MSGIVEMEDFAEDYKSIEDKLNKLEQDKMKNLREVKDDLLKEWIEFREETILTILNKEDKKHVIKYDEISEKILKNVSSQNIQ